MKKVEPMAPGFLGYRLGRINHSTSSEHLRRHSSFDGDKKLQL